MADAPKPKVNPLLTRKVYVGARIAAVRDEMKSLTTEKKNVLEKLRSGADLDKKVEKDLKVRKVYLDQRPMHLREELKQLMAERNSINEKLKA